MDDDAARLASAIGSRVKRERRARGWTLDQLATSAGVSRRLLVTVEQGGANPSVATLLRISAALGVGLPTLVEPPASAQPVSVTRRGEGAVLWTGEAGGRGVMLAGTQPPDVVELWDWTLGPGDRLTSEAHLPGTVELLQVLEGDLVLEVDGTAVRLAPGDAARFRGDVAHAYANPATQPGATPSRFSLVVAERGTPAAPAPGAEGHRG